MRPEEISLPRPWISANLAVSADGKISSANGIPSGWTSRADHERLLELRTSADALLVGRGTLEADRMTLTVPGKTAQPLRCIISRNGAIPSDHPVFHTPGGEIHLLVTEQADDEQVAAPVDCLVHRGNLTDFLKTLKQDHAIDRLHCEGGGSLIRSLAALDVIDELHLTLAGHTLFGGANTPTLTGVPSGFFGKSLDFEITRFAPNPETGECFLSYRRIAQ